MKVILVLALRWGVPARHGDIPNAYVKADKEEHLDIYLAIPQGMKIQDGTLRKFGVQDKSYLALQLKKSLYGLKQVGRLRSQLLLSELAKLGFTQCTTDMCLYTKKTDGGTTIVGVYVDDLLVTGTEPSAVDSFFAEMACLSIKDLGVVSKFLGLRIELDDSKEYILDQQVMIELLLKDFELDSANEVQTLIGDD